MSSQAIQTRYKGYHFRSRLEARWAVFYDNWNFYNGHAWWDYEPEGVEFKGIRYLPDFLYHTPSWRIIIEIKPLQLEMDGDTYERVVREAFNKLIIAAQYFDARFAFLHEGIPGEHYSHRIDMTEFSDYTLEEILTLPNDFYLIERFIWKSKYSYGVDADDAKAVNAARSARFEHGECGRT